MQIPAVIHLEPHDYQVRSDPETVSWLASEGRRGDSSNDNLTIRVDPNLPCTALAETLLHEALHMCAAQASIDDDEDLVNRMAPRVLALLRANPELVEFLTAEG